MEIISFIILILLSLVGYCAGAVVKADKSVELKPQLIDLFMVLIIWTGAIYSRIVLDLNKLFLILIWVIVSLITGILVVWPRKLSKEKAVRKIRGQQKLPKNTLMKLWQDWKNFSARMGNFQSRILLSMFFFIFVSPFALGTKIFSDPLKIKYRNSGSHWHLKKEIKADLDQFKRQF